jgi:membrane protease YdiL (CAAX protease family)
MIELAAILIYAGIMARIERRPFGTYGLPWRRALRTEFWQGAAVGFVSLTALVITLHLAGALRVGAPPTPLLKSAAFGAVYAILFVLLAMREEFMSRGYGLFTTMEIAGFWPAAVISTAWFAWSHSGNSNENALGITVVAAFGLLACLMLRRTGNLWMPIGFHAVWDWGQTYLFGVGDSGHPPAPGHLLTSTVSQAAPAWLSGASVGPEGSALCLGLLAILAVLYARVLRGVRYPPQSAPDSDRRTDRHTGNGAR